MSPISNAINTDFLQKILIMKIKDDVCLWTVLENALSRKVFLNYDYDEVRKTLDEILELDDSDFQNIIQFCAKHRMYKLQKEYEEKYRCWKHNGNASDCAVKDYLGHFIYTAMRTKKSKQQRSAIRNEALEVFKGHNQLLNDITKASEFYCSYAHDERLYLRCKRDWEHRCEIMRKLNTLKEQGISPQDFRWNLVEEPEADEE